MEISERFRIYQRVKGLTHRGLSSLSGISVGTVCRFIRGEPIGSDRLEKILAVCLDLSLEWLFRGAGPMCLNDVSIDNSQTLEYLRLISEKDRLIREKDVIIIKLQRLLMEKS